MPLPPQFFIQDKEGTIYEDGPYDRDSEDRQRRRDEEARRRREREARERKERKEQSSARR